MPTHHHAPAVELADMLPAPSPSEAAGPRNDAERRLLSLLQEGLDSGPPIRMTVPELMADLRASILSH